VLPGFAEGIRLIFLTEVSAVGSQLQVPPVGEKGNKGWLASKDSEAIALADWKKLKNILEEIFEGASVLGGTFGRGREKNTQVESQCHVACKKSVYVSRSDLGLQVGASSVGGCQRESRRHAGERARTMQGSVDEKDALRNQVSCSTLSLAYGGQRPP